MRSGARADAALELRVGQFFVGVHLVRLHLRLVVDDEARALREPEPATVVRAQVGRNALVQHLRVDRLEQAIDLRPPQARGIDQQDHIGRAVRAFGLQPLHQWLVTEFDAVRS